MYIVVSKWGVLPGREAEAEVAGRKVREVIRGLSGVEFVQGLINEDGVWVAIIGYQDEATYRALVQDPNGPFAKAVTEHGLDKLAVWAGSDRGPAMD